MRLLNKLPPIFLSILLVLTVCMTATACGPPARERLVKVAGYGQQLRATLEANWTLPDSLADQGLITTAKRDEIKRVFESARTHVDAFNTAMREVLAEERPTPGRVVPIIADLISDVRALSSQASGDKYRKVLATIEVSLRAIANYFAVTVARAKSAGYREAQIAAACGDPTGRLIKLIESYAKEPVRPFARAG